MQQALTADSIDIGIGSGPGMAFMAKGVPAKAVAAMAGVPRNMAVMVGYNSPIKTVDDLKGKKLGCTTVGSLTDWIGKRINTLKGWGTDGITMVPIGGMPPARAAIKTGQIDGYIGALEVGYALEEAKEWRVITTATPFVDHFITHVFFVRKSVIEKRPQAVRAFLKGWFDTIAFMKANKDKTVEITSKVINLSPSVISRAYDEQIGIFIDGRHVRSEGGGRAQEVVHRDGPAQGNARRQGAVHDAVPAGEGRHVAGRFARFARKRPRPAGGNLRASRSPTGAPSPRA